MLICDYIYDTISCDTQPPAAQIPAHQPLWPDWNATKKDAMLARLFKVIPLLLFFLVSFLYTKRMSMNIINHNYMNVRS